MKMREKMLVVLLLAAVVMVWVFLPLARDLIQRAQDTQDWQDVGGPARSPWWYVTHCDYVELDPMDLSPDVPDGVYENCDEAKGEITPTAFELLAQKVFDFGRKMLATYREGPGGPVKSPDTWEHWFPTVPKPDGSSTKLPKKDLSDMHNDKTLDPTRIVPGEPARHWEITPVRRLKGSVIY